MVIYLKPSPSATFNHCRSEAVLSSQAVEGDVLPPPLASIASDLFSGSLRLSLLLAATLCVGSCKGVCQKKRSK